MKNQTKPLRIFWRLMAPDAKLYIGAFICAVLGVVVQMISPMMFSVTLDSVIGTQPFRLPRWLADYIQSLGGRAYILERMWLLLAVVLVLNVSNGLFNYLKERWNATGSENMAMSLRQRLFAHLQHLPYSYHATAATGDLIQRCTSDVDTIKRFLGRQLPSVTNTLLQLIIAMVILLAQNVALTLISLMLTPVLFLFAWRAIRRVHDAFQLSDAAEGVLGSVIQENLSGVRVVRAFGQQRAEELKMKRASEDFRDKAFQGMKNIASYEGSCDLICSAQIMLSILFGVLFATRGEITLGTMVVFNIYVTMLVFPIRQLGRTLADMSKCMVSIRRIHEILDVPAEPDEPNALKPSLHGDIVFDHVAFGFGTDHQVLKDICCTIPAGKTVALLGSTGSGKSILVSMLQRLYAPEEGTITIGGVPIEQIDRHYLRSRVGLILQEPFLYSKTILENVGIVKDHPTVDMVADAVNTASARDFIERSEKGYDTLVGEKGVTLSGGQKQRVAIARTLMKDNDILIFDDSLSAVDTETDAQIRKALQTKKRGMTTIIISHRLTTLSQADLILVMEDGRITQQGTHEELCSVPGLYQRIHQIQDDMEFAEEELQ